MPIDDAKAFINKMNEDERFRYMILRTDSIAERSELIRQQGFDFVQDEYDEVRDKIISKEGFDTEETKTDRSVEEATREKWINQIFTV